MRSIVRRDTGESYQAFLAGLATASGVETPTREGLARLDRKRKKKTSNTDWTLTTISSSHRLIPAVRGRLASLATFAVNSSAAITCTTGC